MMLLVLLGCIMLNSRLVNGAVDPYCIDNCKCCKDGACTTGKYGWTNVCTKGCIDGHRGARCYELCQYTNCRNCEGSSTYDLGKTCKECYDGYYLGPNKDCTLECQPNCKSCTSSTRCTACKEGFYDKDGSTTCKYAVCPENCECSETISKCIACNTGFYNASTNCSSTCPLNCNSCVSKDKCHECKTGYYNGYGNDINRSLLLNNCTYSCRDTCTKCQSYSNCSECINGKYSPTCQKDCSVGCKDRTCLTDSGICDCSVNFSGDKCTECVDGKYGQYCNRTCPRYCKNKTCDKTLGYCLDGCISQTITGSSCSTCRLGKYGEICQETCPEKCKDSECDRYSGICDSGCHSDFNGSFCDECVHGKYGENCEHSCSNTCAGDICENTEGNCYSCVGNYHGEKCDSCRSDYFGQDCYEECSPACAMTSCDRDTGSCINGCRNGFSGDRCCVESENCMECSSNKECKKCNSGYFQHLCNEMCPTYCKSSCEFLTGVCDDCETNRYGAFCNFSCSKNCNSSQGVKGTHCSPSDGTCFYGCDDGFYSSTCNKTCSSLCVGNACQQDTGICLKGCDGQKDDPACVSNIESTDCEKTVTAAVIGSLFAMSVIINLMQGLFIIKQRKMVSRRNDPRQLLDVAYENQLAVTDLETSNSGQYGIQHERVFPSGETNTASENKTTVYEEINREKDEDHDYQQISSIPTTTV